MKSITDFDAARGAKDIYRARGIAQTAHALPSEPYGDTVILNNKKLTFVLQNRSFLFRSGLSLYRVNDQPYKGGHSENQNRFFHVR